MPIELPDLKNLIAEAFPDSRIEVKDLAGDNDHYEVSVVSTAFTGKSRIEQHKMVQNAVKGHEIHALAIRTGVS